MKGSLLGPCGPPILGQTLLPLSAGQAQRGVQTEGSSLLVLLKLLLPFFLISHRKDSAPTNYDKSEEHMGSYHFYSHQRIASFATSTTTPPYHPLTTTSSPTTPFHSACGGFSKTGGPSGT